MDVSENDKKLWRIWWTWTCLPFVATLLGVIFVHPPKEVSESPDAARTFEVGLLFGFTILGALFVGALLRVFYMKKLSFDAYVLWRWIYLACPAALFVMQAVVYRRYVFATVLAIPWLAIFWMRRPNFAERTLYDNQRMSLLSR